jgi:hypothetical protein
MVARGPTFVSARLNTLVPSFLCIDVFIAPAPIFEKFHASLLRLALR